MMRDFLWLLLVTLAGNKMATSFYWESKIKEKFDVNIRLLCVTCK